MSIWDRFDGIATADEVKTAQENFKPLDAGQYEMKLEEITAGESQAGLPMVKGVFRLVDGGRKVFYNQGLQNIQYPDMTSGMIAEAVNFVGGLLGEEIEFTTLSAFADTIGTIIVGNTYIVEVSYGKKDAVRKYPKFKIIPVEVPDNGEVPFDT